MTAKRILVVDDDAKIRTLLRRCLESDGYEVAEAEGSDSVRAAFAEGDFDLVTLDLNLGAEDGLDIARELQREHDVPIFLVTLSDRIGTSHDGLTRCALPMSRADIADFLGLTIETVSRTLTRLRKAGVIVFDRAQTVLITDMDALVSAAQARD